MLTERRAEEYVRQSDLRVPAPLKPASRNRRYSEPVCECLGLPPR